ncbi:midasin [Protopterus annectens]|uniref:midasin n=1 Tax=Protopterus annectens TaxID=7888 RepID=UPI001CFA798F|nr:midasin [Protopterus annectens]
MFDFHQLDFRRLNFLLSALVPLQCFLCLLCGWHFCALVTVWTLEDRQCILGTFAQLLLDKECTLHIGRHLRTLLLDLLERNVETIKANGQISHDLHERLCVAMSKLIDLHPDVVPFALRYFAKSPPVFQRLFLESTDSSTLRYGRRRMKLRDLMEAAWRFLRQNPAVYSELWDWSICVPLLKSHDTLVRWYTANCLVVVTRMSEQYKLRFMEKTFAPEDLLHFRLKLLEEVERCNVENALVLANSNTAFWQREKCEDPQDQIVSSDLSAGVVAVCGVLLPRLSLPDDQSNRLVLVESTCQVLQQLAMAVASQKAILLEGPIGCGKTALIEYLAARTSRVKPPHILKVQLGDQTDSKMLLGMYRCTDIPGQFVWQPGTLTLAVSNGFWILLEDVDYAPLDVISVLIPLLENGELLIPGRADCIKVAPGFQFFATRRLSSSSGGDWHRQSITHAKLLDKLWTKVKLSYMSRTEMKEVLQVRYPSLKLVTERLLDIYCQLTGDRHQTSDTSFGSPGNDQELAESSDVKEQDKKLGLEGRGLSLRDLLKLCNRIATSFNSTSPSTALNVFHEALDCFTAMLSKQGSRQKMAEVIGSKLNISKKQAEHYCQLYKPAISVTETEITVGRVTVSRKDNEVVQLHMSAQTFAETRPSLVLIEQLAVCVSRGEPVLLVGETGTGKTSTVQYLATITGHKLRVVNMNQQSDTSDLLGGYKPVDHKLIFIPLIEAFEQLFVVTFSRKQNNTFLGHINMCFKQKRWADLLTLMKHVHKTAVKKEGKSDGLPLNEKWEALGHQLNQAQQQVKLTENALVFAFVEGTLARAVKNGEWILLDEINLAAAETLECLSSLLEGDAGSLVLQDRGDTEPIVRHPDFRLFACMNPATDVGKKNLPPGIRNRFTEVYVDELESEKDLHILIADYLKGLNLNKSTIPGIIKFYLTIRREANSRLRDGTGHRPHYSLRTLCRALRFAALNPCVNIQRSLYEGFCLSFLTQLDRVSHPVVEKLICQYIISNNNKNLLKQPIPEPQVKKCIQIEGYWIPVGDKPPAVDETYILTSSVRLNLKDLTRIVSAGNHPVLIQGETSVGKTSLIQWLASVTGNHCVRINNHEHTDIQEYIGCYMSDTKGKLVFREGVLIDAMRKGYWIILDELNLAPTDVLEALNRLLDDNRELFITETQEVVKAHPHFMLFATQNPPGLYGGRKVLSRAFRNRFVELHFDELPSAELETILHKRCSLPPSYCTKLVKVMLELQSLRRGSTVFAGKYGFITLRDLFRWANRYNLATQPEKDYDWLRHLAVDGFLLLAGRVRKEEEVAIIQKVLEKHFNKKINPDYLFSEECVKKQLESLSAQFSVMDHEFYHIVWTQPMRRLAVLLGRALEFGEPVLLVGDTGCGKTSVCQLFAALASQKLYSVNCHQHMETSDFLGGLRPIRQRSEEKDDSKLFEWNDGPLVLAMKEDGMFLLDEISLADDSVLERLNSVLEVEKTLVLAERGSGENDDIELLIAGRKFRIMATMNPGGDFGKKELSPALRNRFTEIWCPQINTRADLVLIIKHNLKAGLSLNGANHEGDSIAELALDFIEWLINQDFGCRCIQSIRDLMTWVQFMNTTTADGSTEKMETEAENIFHLDAVTAFVHAACLVYIDGIGSGTTSCAADVANAARLKCLDFLVEKLAMVTDFEGLKCFQEIYNRRAVNKPIWSENYFGIHPFFIPRGPLKEITEITDYTLSAGTTAMNAQRVLRGLQLNRPILLEGSPGVGKTSLVTALAKASGNNLVRINLSEQTDVTDLFGADLPVEGGKGGEFAWHDGPLLAALKSGHWIMLDELNLASQSVLEGLNACFDHRAEVYIPELGRSFQVQSERTKIFGCQNPFRQGGGRNGLPKSFLNRFTQVYVDQLSVTDMVFICDTIFPAIGKSTVAKMVQFSSKIDQQVMVEKKWGHRGSPWEFNLRDLFRWCSLMLADQSPGCYSPDQHVSLIYAERMRTEGDRCHLLSTYKEVFGENCIPYTGSRQLFVTPYNVQVGYSVLPRDIHISHVSKKSLSILHHSLHPLESVMKCVQMGWMVILVGPPASGKTSVVQLLSLLTGHRLRVMAMNSSMDTTELLGGFEQADVLRPWLHILEKVEMFVYTLIRNGLLSTDVSCEDTEVLLRVWTSFSHAYKKNLQDYQEIGVPTEAVNKLEGIILVIQRLNSKLNCFCKAEITDLRDELCSFRQHLNSLTGCSHGTFEWVDGMLVEALKSGDWLLMDNVNFCSSSVLDRLNALLEPGGVLAVSERGMIDGATPTVAPHPDFRLFLTMDPAHGEISRAMRNRGIEIYIAGETGSAAFDSLDVKTLLHGLGLLGDSVCSILISVHSEARDKVPGSHASSVSSLIHAASLVVQQLQRGHGLTEAVRQACWNVYICSQLSQANQKLVVEVVEKQLCLLHPQETWGSSLLAMGLWPDCVPSAMHTAEDSLLSAIYRDGQLLLYCLKRLSLKHSRTVPLTLSDLNATLQSSALEGLTYNEVEAEIDGDDELWVFPAAVRLVTWRASQQDWQLRVSWLNHMAKCSSSMPDLVRFCLEAGAAALRSASSSTLSDEVRNIIDLLQCNLTDADIILLDPRWNMQYLNSLINSVNSDSSVDKMELLELLNNFCNRLALQMDREERSCIEKNMAGTTAEKQAARDSALMLSVGFRQDPETYLPHPVVAHLAPFFDIWDTCIMQCLQSETTLSDLDLSKVLSLMLWRDRFWSVSNSVTADPHGLSLLSLHWYWVTRHLITNLPVILTGHSSERLPQEVQAAVLSIQSYLCSPSETSASVKAVQKLLGRPLPFKDGSVVDCAAQLKVLYAAVDVLTLRPAMENSTWGREVCCLKTAALGWTYKKMMLQAWELVFQANHVHGLCSDVLKTLVDSLSSHFRTEGVLSARLEEGDCNETVSHTQPDPATLIHLSSQIQLWPAVDYLTLLWHYKLVTHILDQELLSRKNLDQSDMQTKVVPLLAFSVKSTPDSRHMQGLWNLLQVNKPASEDLKVLWADLVCGVLDAFWKSSVSTDPAYWATWKPLISTEEKLVKKTILEPSLKGPAILNTSVYSLCFFEILSDCCRRRYNWDTCELGFMASSNVSLGEWMEKTHQLQEARQILWTNMTAASVANFRTTDSRLQGILLHRHLLSIKQLLPDDLQEEYMQHCSQLMCGDMAAFHYIQKVINDVVGTQNLPDDVLCLLLSCLQYFSGEENARSLSSFVQSSCLWIDLGLLQLRLWIPQTMFDPAVKREYKLKYANEELHQLQSEWNAHDLMSQLLTGKVLEDESVFMHCHPRIRHIQQRMLEMKEKIRSLSRKQAFRPQASQYELLYQDIRHYVSSIGQISAVHDLRSRLMQVLHGCGPKSWNRIQRLLSEEAAWQKSQHQFRTHLSETYSLYPDILRPVQAAILQMQHGMRLLASEVHNVLSSMLVPKSDLNNLMTCLQTFPSVNSSFPSYLTHADTLCCRRSKDAIHGIGKLLLKCISGDKSEQGTLRLLPTQEDLLMNALFYIHCHVLSKGEMDQESLQLFRHVCQAVVNDWDEQERQAQVKEQQEASLYRYKSKSHGTGCSEEEEEEKEFSVSFPQYDQDFADIISQPSLGEEMETEDIKITGESTGSSLISQSYMCILMKIHQQICLNFAQSGWYCPSCPSFQTAHFLSAAVSSYHMAATLMAHIYPVAGSDMSNSLIGGQILAGSLIQNAVHGDAPADLKLQFDGPYDFYQHPNIQQVKLCQPVLEDFCKAVQKLLQEWPEHPALIQILVVMDRIRSFPLSSPLSKFLNGLEILLAKSQDWEESASRIWSLRKHLNAVSVLIIQWRKLELNCWSSCLDNAMKRHADKSVKHWVSLYQMIENFLQVTTRSTANENNEELSLASIANTLKAFIEGATLGEFHIRLKMLLVFHCHILLLPQQEGKDSLCSLMWNLYNYYKQFSDSVHSRLTERRHPIEKELKDFVKISRWNDVNFWAIKQSVEKTHRTLFKFVKKFEAALGEPCRPALMEQEAEESPDFVDKRTEQSVVQKLNKELRSVFSTSTNTAQVTFSPEIKTLLDTESLQGRLPSLMQRMQKLCNSYVKECSVPSWIEGLDQFTGDVITSVHDLRDMTVDQTADKEKQKSEVKHILMQKQRALSELFKLLTRMGLSYKKGLIWSRSEDPLEFLGLHPLDLSNILSMDSNTAGINATLFTELSSAWDGCQKYFVRGVARHNRLQTALLSPVKELGFGNTERCKGFTAHLMKLLIQQRRALTTLTEQWAYLRSLLRCVQEIQSQILMEPKMRSAVLPPQNATKRWVERLHQLSVQCATVLEQLSLFLQCCPQESDLGKDVDKSIPDDPFPLEARYPSPVPTDQLPAGCRMRKQDSLWLQLNNTVHSMSAEIMAIKTELQRAKKQHCGVSVHSWHDFEVCSSGMSCLNTVSTQLLEVEDKFIPVGEPATHLPGVVESLRYVRQEVDKTLADFSAWKADMLTVTERNDGNQEFEQEFLKEFSDEVELSINTVLCAVQSLIKRKKIEIKEQSGEVAKDAEEEENQIQLELGHLTKLLDEELWADISALRVQNVVTVISGPLRKLKVFGEYCVAEKHQVFNHACYLFARLLPMLSTYTDLVLFYLTVSSSTHRTTSKLLCVLTSMFTDLAQKGFCLPKELMEEADGEGASEFHDYEGGGIGEGEGMKDVSDKIDDEEQVEDTCRQGQEKDEEEEERMPDIKEEENAIEMSEDFEGKMHDGELQKEEDEEKSESEEEQLDKQMGDLGNAEADKLDERLWGDDDDEGVDESKAEEFGEGMDQGESELVAKDDNLAERKNDKKRDEEEKMQDSVDEKDGEEKIHEQLDEREYDENEIDPYHGMQEKVPEVQPLDLPDDLNLEKEEESQSDEEKQEDGEGENPYEIEDQIKDSNECQEGEEKDDVSNQEEGEPGQDVAEEGTSEDKEEAKEPKEDGTAEKGESEAEESEGASESMADKPEDENEKVTKEDEDMGIPADQGQQAKDDEENPEEEDDLPECSKRMEHEADGQTGDDNLQSDSAVELAGSASEKDQAKEEHGSGASDAMESEGHESRLMARLPSQKQVRERTQRFKRKPGQADNERSMGDYSDRVQKRLKTIESSDKMEQKAQSLEQKTDEADAYEHIKEGSKSYDAQTYDVATAEQQKPARPAQEEEKDVHQAEDIAMETDEQEENLQAIDIQELKSEEIKPSATETRGKVGTETELQPPSLEDGDFSKQEAKEGDTNRPERSRDSTIHTVHALISDTAAEKIVHDPEELRRELERHLDAWQNQQPGTAEEEKEAAEMWQQYQILTSPLSQQLCEQLRLILEPTQAAKLRGDYRTGKRLNMRKVIPYIASQFRKDKIWLRRTKPSKRQYQICLAVDDSSSMIDNHSKQLAFESLSVIGNALSLLEVGQIAICSFGETFQLLHPFHEQFSDQSGARILRHCKFQQKKTKIAQFLDAVADMFVASRQQSQISSLETSQLLLIVSDGRGLFLEGKERVISAVQGARDANVFVIFVVLDDPNSRDSILDIKVPVFKGPEDKPEIKSYMEEFPFPFYIILRDVNALPETLSDALRQWFELVTVADL